MTREEFLDLTPAQFHAIGKRHELKIQQADYRAGLIASILYNIHRGDNPTLQPKDFFHSLADLSSAEGEQAPNRKEMTGEEMLLHMMSVVATKPV